MIFYRPKTYKEAHRMVQLSLLLLYGLVTFAVLFTGFYLLGRD